MINKSKNIKNKLKRILNNNKGSNLIQAVLIVMVILVDVAKIMIKFNSISSTSTYIAETISNQGGLLTYVPSYADSNYRTSSNVLTDITENLSYSGISSSDFTLYIDGLAVNGTYPGVQKDYGSPLTVKLDVKYKFPLLGNFIPQLKNVDFTVSSDRSTKSMFKLRNSGNLDTSY